jgi:DinB superfamily
MSNPYSQRNAAELEHLEKLAGSLTDAQVAFPAGGSGWTVGGILGHLAFWDQRAVGLLRRWKAGTIGPSAIDIDAVNDAMRPLLNALSPRAAVQLAIASAREIDREIDALDAGMLAKVEADGKPVRLDRAAHRIHHLEQIQKAIR